MTLLTHYIYTRANYQLTHCCAEQHLFHPTAYRRLRLNISLLLGDVKILEHIQLAVNTSGKDIDFKQIDKKNTKAQSTMTFLSTGDVSLIAYVISCGSAHKERWGEESNEKKGFFISMVCQIAPSTTVSISFISLF